MANPDTRIRYIVTSTWGQDQILADSPESAEEAHEDFLKSQGYTDPSNMILDGLTTEYDPNAHGEWEGE